MPQTLRAPESISGRDDELRSGCSRMAADDLEATLEMAGKEVIDVSTKTLTRRDVIGTTVAALTVLVYVANVHEWGYLTSNRWAAVSMVVIGIVGCSLAARLEDENWRSVPIVILGALGIVALVLGFVAIATGAGWVLLALTIVLVVLWAGTTLRHALTPAHPLAAH